METLLTLASEGKSWRARVEGPVLTQSSWTGSGKPRETTKSFASASEASGAFEKSVQKKMREGFAFVRAAASAAPGDVVLDMLAPNRSSSAAFDLSLDGRTVALGTTLKDAYGAQIHLIDVATGHLRTIHEEAKGNGQTFVHAVAFDAAGTSLVYALNGETRRLELASARTGVIAQFVQYVGTRFNPFCVRPSWDGARRRLLVFDAGDRARVLGPDHSTLLEVSTASPSSECRSGALSQSGERLALYRASRFLIYGHADAEHDTTNHIEVWDVDSKTLIKKVPVSWKIDKIGFDPTGTRLLFCHEFAQGPGELSIETGEKLWHREDPSRSDRWGTCFSWAHSPDGRVLAVGGFGLRFLDDGSHAESAMQPGEPRLGQRVYRIVYSANGSLVASGGDHGRIQVLKA